MTNTVTFFEIAGPDTEALRRFYAELLGIAFDPPVEGYHLHARAQVDVGGGIWDGGGLGTWAIPYVEVPDVDAAVAAARAAGTTVLVEPFAHGPFRAAHLADPAGNRIGVYGPPAPPST